MKPKILSVLILLTLVLTACGGGQSTDPTATSQSLDQATVSPAASESAATGPASEANRTLTVMTHDSFAVSEEVIAAFEKENGVKVQILEAGDAGTALNKAILSKNNPLADVFYGVDNTFLSRAIQEEIFEPYASPLLGKIPDEFKLDAQNGALPVDYGDVCLNYDKAYFSDQQVTPPATLEDLLKPEYKGLLVVPNPATSSPGLAFMLATIGHFGEDEFLKYWEGLVENDLLVVNDWETAYNTEFTRGGGTRPIVVSYGSSPAFEVIYASSPVDEAPTAAVVSDGACFRQIEFVGVLKGTQNQDLAQKWVDFMLSPTFQEDVPMQMFVFPVNPDAKLDEAFVKYMAMPEETAQVTPDQVAEKRENWIQLWTQTVLR